MLGSSPHVAVPNPPPRISMDPWYDYLALPVAPCVVLLQAVTLASGRRRLRRIVAVVATSTVATMFVVVVLQSEPRDANIGAGLLLFSLIGSIALLVVAFLDL